jgi:two-component system sensor histidine kinase AlgZ
MYPILTQRNSFLLYLACWLPNALLIAALFVFAGGLNWIASIALALPMAVLYAFLCLSSWHLCRYFPLQKTNFFRLLAVHAIAAFISSSIWVLLGKAIVTILGSIPSLELLQENYSSLIPLLVAVGILLFLLNVAGSYLMISFERNKEMETRSLELRFLAQQAEMRALKAQIDPHFLFNSLNSISALTSIDPEASRKMCLMLSDFLRKSLRLGGKKLITFEEELDLVSGYLSIEHIRLGPRLTTNMRIEEEIKNCAVPPLLLQPLVENALNHGIRHLLAGGEVRIAAEKSGSRLRITVENPQDPEKPPQKGEGIGLDNVRQRMKALFASEARLECFESENLFRAVLIMPARNLAEMQLEKFS